MYQLDFSMFTELFCVVLSSGALLSVCGEQPFILSPAWVGNFYRIPLVNNLIECNPDPPLDSFPGYKSWPVEIPFSPSLGLLISITFSDSCEFQLNLVSTQHPPLKASQFQNFFPCTIFLHFPYLILPISIPTYSQYT